MNILNKIANIGSKAMKAIGGTKAGMVVKAKSPEILIGTGIALVLGGTYMACRATAKAQDVLEARKDEIEAIYAKAENLQFEADIDNEDDAKFQAACKEIQKEVKSDILVANVRCGWELAKLYAPAIAMELAGIACFLGAHGIMRKRNAALMAAYEATDKAYRRLKEQQEGKMLSPAPDADKNTEGVVSKAEQDYKNAPFNLGPYAFCFDESCDIWHPDAIWNLDEAKAIERVLDTRLKAGRTIFLNDVRTAFGADNPGPNVEGQIICWSLDRGDTEVNFNLPVHPTDKSFWINPNCHNVIFDVPDLRRR